MMLEKSELPISVNGDFEDGEEVIEYLRENEADIIITDIRMPNTDGLELAKYVQEHMPKCSVVIETGYEDFQYARNALRYQVKDYLTKPINEAELIKSIKDILVEKTKAACRVHPDSKTLYHSQSTKSMSYFLHMSVPPYVHFQYHFHGKRRQKMPSRTFCRLYPYSSLKSLFLTYPCFFPVSSPVPLLVCQPVPHVPYSMPAFP